jgi:methyl-accepting chemotaxis protein
MFANLRIGARLGLGFGVVLALMAAMVAFAAARLSTIGAAADDIVHQDWVKAEAAATLHATTRANAQRTMELFFHSDKAQLARVHERIADNKRVVTESLETLERLVHLPEGKALLAQVKEARASYVASFTKVDTLLAEGKRDAATQVLTGETLPAIEALQGHVKALSEFQRKLAEAGGENIEHSIAFTRQLLFAAGLAALAIGAALAWWLTRAITRPIGEAVKIAQTVAAGDLSSRIEAHTQDETGQLLRALRAMNDGLVKVVGTVRQSSDSIAIGSGQIATGNQDLSQRTEEQASNLQQTAASMEQISGAVKSNADSAQQAAQLAASATEVALQGGQVVEQVIGTMGQITGASRRIGDIIGVIDGIAFQTNILALNAAVEAARAGEQGRGFAVVAGEVRSLAQRSAAAAKEVKTLINDSVEKVGVGSQQVDEAGRTMQRIVVQVKRVNDLMSEISAATLEQTSGISQVSAAVGQLDQVTQQNAALVEESAAAAESLKQQARQLVEAVSVFKLAHAESEGAIAPAPAGSRVRAAAAKPSTAANLAQAAAARKPVAAMASSESDWTQF